MQISAASLVELRRRLSYRRLDFARRRTKDARAGAPRHAGIRVSAARAAGSTRADGGKFHRADSRDDGRSFSRRDCGRLREIAKAPDQWQNDNRGAEDV